MRIITFFTSCMILLQISSVKAQTFSFDHDSVSRSYIVHLPPSYSASNFYPLVINMHGYTSNASEEQLYTEMDAVADTANFIVVYPNGLGNPTSWNSGQNWSYNPGINDVTFISALIDTMSANYSIDSSMVYACGMSNGGYMSYRLACELENKIVAIASVTGVMADSIYNSCQTDRPVPILHIHGTTDPTVNYNGAPGSTAVETGIDWWVQNNNCPSSPTVTNLPDINMTDFSTVDKYYYGPCDNSSEVILFKINGGGHTWPGAFPLPVGTFGNTNQDIEASGEIWLFFRRHKMPDAPVAGVSEQEQPETIIMVYPNPFTDVVTLTNLPSNVERIQLFNLLGKSLGSYDFSRMNSREIQLNLSGISKGSYLLRAETNNSYLHVLLVKQ